MFWSWPCWKHFPVPAPSSWAKSRIEFLAMFVCSFLLRRWSQFGKVTIVNLGNLLHLITWSYLPVIRWDYPPNTFVPWDPLPLNTIRKSVGGMAFLVHYDSDENIVGAADPARAWRWRARDHAQSMYFCLANQSHDLSIAPTKKKKTSIWKTHSGSFRPRIERIQ